MIANYLSRLGAMLIIAAAFLLAMGLISALTGCTTPAVTIPLINAEKYGSLTAYGTISYQAPDHDTLADK